MSKAETEIAELLQCAKVQIVKLAAAYAGGGEYERAHVLIESAREVDHVEDRVRDSNGLPSRRPPSPSRSLATPANLPAYYIDRRSGKLVKIGPGRDGGTYEHRVPHEDYDRVVGRLTEMARAGGTGFETRRLIDRCGIPGHEPRIVLDVLERNHLLTSPRRGNWEFVNAQEFSDAVQEVWSRLPKR